MDYSSFGLAGPPFSLQPSGDAVFMSATHCEVFAALQWGLGDPDGFVLVVGEPGTGKTTMLAKLLRDEHPTLRPIYVNPPCSMGQIISMIATLSGMPATTGTTDDFTQRVRNYLEAYNLRVALILDEAQAFPDEMLEQLRLFANSSLDQKGRVKLILVAHPQLRERLGKPALSALNQRIVTRAELTSLTKAEISAYIDYRLRLHGCSIERLFTSRALRRVVRSVKPIPREINTLCQNALILSYASSRTRIDIDAVNAALSERRASPLYQRGRIWLQRQDDYVRRSIAIAGFVALSASASAVFLPKSYEMLRSTSATQPRWANQVRGGHEYSSSVRRAPKLASLAKKVMSPQTAGLSTQELSAAPVTSPTSPEFKGISVFEGSYYSDDISASSNPKLPDESTAAPAKTADISTSSVPGPAASVGRAVVIRKGDTLIRISLNYLGHFDNATLDEILQVNPQVSNPNLIFPGQTIQLPAKSE